MDGSTVALTICQTRRASFSVCVCVCVHLLTLRSDVDAGRITDIPLTGNACRACLASLLTRDAPARPYIPSVTTTALSEETISHTHTDTHTNT